MSSVMIIEVPEAFCQDFYLVAHLDGHNHSFTFLYWRIGLSSPSYKLYENHIPLQATSVILNRFQPEDFSRFLYIIQIVKMGWIAHSKELRVYSVSENGIELKSPLFTTLASGGRVG